MRSSVRSIVVTLAILSGLVAPRSDAANIYDVRTASISKTYYGDASTGNIIGIALNAGATGYTIDSVTLIPVASSSNTATATVGLYALDANNNPTGSPIATESRSISFIDISTASPTDQVTITPTNPAAWRMEANNKYTLLVTANTTDGGISLPQSLYDTPDMTGAGMTYLGAIGSQDNGVNWTLSTSFTPWAHITGSPISVPEPSTYALGLIATGLLASLARRRKARAKA